MVCLAPLLRSERRSLVSAAAHLCAASGLRRPPGPANGLSAALYGGQQFTGPLKSYQWLFFIRRITYSPLAMRFAKVRWARERASVSTNLLMQTVPSRPRALQHEPCKLFVHVDSRKTRPEQYTVGRPLTSIHTPRDQFS